MRAIRFDEYGDTGGVHIAEVDRPEPGPGEIRIAVRAAGVNGIDWKIVAGYLRDDLPLALPAGVGADAAGVVDAVGPEVDGVAVGDAVFGTGSATYAEFAVLRDWVAKPEGLSFEEAAGFPVPAETALRILDLLALQPGQTLLISGASGGVGSAAVQFAKDRGLVVIATASEANQDYLRGLGAIPTTYGDGLVERVRELAPDGVDGALDISGSGVIADLIDLTGEASQVVSIADFTAPGLGARVSSTGTDQRAAFADAARLWAAGEFTLAIERSYELHEAALALAASQAGHTTGRLIITI